MAQFVFNLPDIGEGIAEAEIVAWHVQPGDRIAEDQRLADVMTDKATVEMESPVAGVVRTLAGAVGDTIAIGAVLVVIETDTADGEGTAEGATTPPPPPPAAPTPQATPAPAPVRTAATATTRSASVPAPQPAAAANAPEPPAPSASRPLATPAVRARAADLGIDLAQVRPAADGRIRHADLDAFVAYAHGYAAAPPRRADEVVRVIGMRRRIADNMAAAKRHIPHFTYVEEIDVTDFEALRGQLNAASAERPRLTMLPLLVTAICRTVARFPMLNARYDDEAGVVTRHGAVHLGMATQTDAGLMVPVIRDAQAKNPWQLAAEIARLAEAARSGKATSAELSGSTLTVTSLGPLGGVATTPVVNRPEVAIIGPNRIVERPMFVPDGLGGERIARRKLMNLSISCDHRVVDGWDAASFVQALRRLLETPTLLLTGE